MKVDAMSDRSGKDTRDRLGHIPIEGGELPKVKRKKKRPPKIAKTYRLDPQLVERIRCAAWWQRKEISAFVEQILRDEMDELERDHGGPFPGPEDR